MVVEFANLTNAFLTENPWAVEPETVIASPVVLSSTGRFTISPDAAERGEALLKPCQNISLV